jgi:YfiH family protein
MYFNFEKIIYGISERTEGNMRIDGNFEKIGLKNRKLFFDKLGISNLDSVLVRQRHSCNVLVIDKDFEQKVHDNFDGLVTKDKRFILCITVGDCLPLYFYDSKKEVIGIAHAGWKGVLGNISKNMVEKMSLEFGSKPEDVEVKIGPHIKGCHFLVKDDVSSKFIDYKKHFKESKDGISINLSSIVTEQLTSMGVLLKNIDTDNECTHCNKKFFSYRRDKPEFVETMMAYIAMK